MASMYDRARQGMLILLPLAFGWGVMGCGGGGSQSSGPLTALPPASEASFDSPTSEVTEGISADLPPFSPPSSTPPPTPAQVPDPTPEPTEATSTQSVASPQFVSITVPETTPAGYPLSLRAEVSTPGGLKELEIGVVAPLGLGMQFDLPPEELGCSRGAVRCTLQGTVDLPKGITGRYQLSLTLYDLLDQTATESLSIQVNP